MTLQIWVSSGTLISVTILDRPQVTDMIPRAETHICNTGSRIMIEAISRSHGDRFKVVAKCPDRPTEDQWQEFRKAWRGNDALFFRHSQKRKDLFWYSRLCPTCKSVLLVNRSLGGQRRYCSDECRIQSTDRVGRSQKKQTKCKQCGNTFAASRSDAKYCSAKCRVAWNRAN